VLHRGGEGIADKEGLLPFKLIEEKFGEALTSYGGLPFVVETCEALGLGRLVKQQVRIKQRHRGYTESKAKGKGVNLTPSRFRSWPQETRVPLSPSPTTTLTSVQG
jgi:hypothetical protein